MKADYQIIETRLKEEILGLIRKLVVEPVLEQADGVSLTQLHGLQAALGEDLKQVVDNWQRSKIEDLVDWAAVVLACLAEEELKPGRFLQVLDERGPASEVTDSDRPDRPARSGRSRRFRKLPGGLKDLAVPSANEKVEVPNGVSHDSNGSGRAATITVPELERFLRPNGYSPTSSGNGDQVWKSATGAIVSLPRTRGDLKRPVQAKLLKLLSEQLGARVGIRNGHVSFIE